MTKKKKDSTICEFYRSGNRITVNSLFEQSQHSEECKINSYLKEQVLANRVNVPLLIDIK